MGQTVILTCDLHSDNTPATGTLAFAVGRRSYEIELCDKHLKEFNDKLSPFTNGARSASGPRKASAGARPAAPRRAAARRGRGKGIDVGTVREWARGEGYEISSRGRIPGAILDAYKAANKG